MPGVVSVCRALPSDDAPSSHVFVMQRIAAMAKIAEVQALEPVPYFPLLKPLPGSARLETRQWSGVRIAPVPMFYLPGAFKQFDGKWMQRAIAPHARRLVDQGKLDVLDAHFGYPEGVACVRLARLLGVDSYLTIRGFEVDLLGVPTIRRQLLDAIDSASGCISVSHSLKETMVRNGVDARQITVIPNAVDRTLFAPGDLALARRQLGVEGSSPIIVSVGRLVSGKRHHVLVEAFGRLRQRHPDALLCVIGPASFENAYPDRLRELASRFGGEQSIRILGSVEQGEVVRWLRAADVFALATEREGCCNAVVEALAVGVPVVTTPAGDNPHFVKDGQNGYIVPVDDVPATAAALDRAVSTAQWDRQSISRNLAVGNWGNVAGQVLQYCAERRGIREQAMIRGSRN
jgi:glycosyltransferase involved in cell wall biosynthesis